MSNNVTSLLKAIKELSEGEKADLLTQYVDSTPITDVVNALHVRVMGEPSDEFALAESILALLDDEDVLRATFEKVALETIADKVLSHSKDDVFTLTKLVDRIPPRPMLDCIKFRDHWEYLTDQDYLDWLKENPRVAAEILQKISGTVGAKVYLESISDTTLRNATFMRVPVVILAEEVMNRYKGDQLVLDKLVDKIPLKEICERISMGDHWEYMQGSGYLEWLHGHPEAAVQGLSAIMGAVGARVSVEQLRETFCTEEIAESFELEAATMLVENLVKYHGSAVMKSAFDTQFDAEAIVDCIDAEAARDLVTEVVRQHGETTLQDVINEALYSGTLTIDCNNVCKAYGTAILDALTEREFLTETIEHVVSRAPLEMMMKSLQNHHDEPQILGHMPAEDIVDFCNDTLRESIDDDELLQGREKSVIVRPDVSVWQEQRVVGAATVLKCLTDGGSIAIRSVGEAAIVAHKPLNKEQM